MVVTLDDTRPVDYAVMGAAGLATLIALSGGLYTVPWHRCRRARATAPKATRGAGFNVLWRGRAVLSLLSAAWALSQLLRVSSLWGANSLVFSEGVTAWTGAGWMCRIYLTAALGVMQPLCAFTALLMLTAALSRRHRPEAMRHPNSRLLGLALLCTLPVAAVQAVVAWLGLAVQYRGEPLEDSPRSILGWFFATYWQGSPQECGSGGSGGAEAGDGGCTLCAFPAAAVATHAVFCVAFLVALAVTCSRLAAAALNARLRRRMRLFQAAYSFLMAAGLVAMGVSIVQGPFSWLNQACWAAYVATVVLTVALVEWEVVVWPVADLRSVDKRLALWADATTAAFAAAASDEAAMSTQSSGGSAVLIKAHGRSADAEAYVQAAAAARALSVTRGAQPPTRPPPLTLPPPSPYRAPARQVALSLPPSAYRAPRVQQGPLQSPQRQPALSAPPLSPSYFPPPSPQRPRQPLLPSAPPLSPQQLYP